jgi:hypothetical protein
MLAFAWVERGQGTSVAVSVDGGKNWVRKTLERNHQRNPLDATGPAIAHSDSGGLHTLTVRGEEKDGPQALLYRRLLNGTDWSESVELVMDNARVSIQYPVIAAFEQRVHAAWIEGADGWLNVWYRGSWDSGKTWSERVRLSAPERPTAIMTESGFRRFSGDYMSIAEDGQGVAHIAWGARQEGRGRGEIWHARARITQ